MNNRAKAEINEIKVKGNRYYYFSFMAQRVMPLKKDIANELVATGQASFVEKLWNEM